MSRKTSGSKNASLKSRILLAMGSVLFLFALVLGFFFYITTIMPGQGQDAAQSGLTAASHSAQLQTSLAGVQQIANMFFQNNDPALVEKHKAAATGLVNQATKFKQAATKQGVQKDAAAANKIVSQSQSYKDSFQQLAQTHIKRGDIGSGLRGQLNTAAQNFYAIVQRNEVSDLALAVLELHVQQEEYLRNNRGASLQNLIGAKNKLERIARETKIDSLEAQLLRKSIRNYSAALDRYQAVSLATNDPRLSSTLGKEQSRQTEALRNAGGEIQSVIARVNVPAVSTLAADVRRAEMNFLLFREDNSVAEFEQSLHALVKAYNTSSILQEHKDELIKASTAYRLAFTSMVANEKKIQELSTSFATMSANLSASIAGLGKAKKSTEPSFTTASNMYNVIAVIAGLVVILVGFLIALVLGNSITTPLKSITQILQRIVKDKDFSVEIPVTSKNEIGALATELNNLLDLQGVSTDHTEDSTVSVSADLEELSALANSLNNSITSLAEDNAKITEVAAIHGEIQTAVEDLIAKIKADAESISATHEKAADQVPQEALSGEVEEISQSLESTFAAIQEITDASSQVADIITQSGDLAEKTNLLALNASVKAARAGSHGREFSALAEEIAQLAQRSEDLSKEAKHLAETISEKIDSVSLDADVKNSLDKVLTAGQKTEGTSSEFTAPAETILNNTDELDRLIDRFSTAIQEVASIAEQQVDKYKTTRTTMASLLAKISDTDERDTTPYAETDAINEDPDTAGEIAISNEPDQVGPEENVDQDEISPSSDEEPEANKYSS